ncbi:MULTISPECIES: VOC family protein [unclassified Lysobacter]|uniref:VOC family protein n=1 Tax=unclassified Lysobacter TaxID=2635362 RepID=UPI001BE6F51D|nr:MULTISPECIES: VOC family protein [unclassified Lysobacter]MBT2748701.1 iron-containing redox enzyme family protein [Lysobacter sp. ISL-42]MBT2751636.1 iron-containing redox enzyme family protein [Lysobacter sp. ISL-50]MBT2775830.1 iron-containing redox enzyme family protein [Lysobacter sp. ISL-54]MBT2782205.1 iron-containing redox enzyme family protein [Lysobacter sp. ISL-52]
MKTVSPSQRFSDSNVDIDQFWKLADDLQHKTVDHAKDMFSFVETASPERLFTLLVQYRYFTVYYITDIALLIARLKPGRMRSFLADILLDELGGGDHAQAHPELYDEFLGSLGIAHPPLDKLALASNIKLLEDARSNLIDPAYNSAYGIGLRGMGGECVCQIYLARLYEHLVLNPYIRANKDKIAWKFWELHVGEHDIAHRENLRKLISDEVTSMDSGSVEALQEGFFDSMTAWSAFWKNIQDEATKLNDQDAGERAAIAEVVLGPTAGKDGGAIHQFHLAIGVHDLQEARQFYCDVLGAKQGRSTKNLIDLDFYGHHLVIHQTPTAADGSDSSFGSAFYGETVKVPHFGMNLNWQDWSALSERIKAKDYAFIDPPHVRMRDMPGEHATMFLNDPSGNSLEFKAFRNHDEVFSVIFSNSTKDIFGLDAIVEKAAAA